MSNTESYIMICAPIRRNMYQRNLNGVSENGNHSQGCNVQCATSHLIVSVYRVPQMQGVGRADDLLYFMCLADAVPCEGLLRQENVMSA